MRYTRALSHEGHMFRSHAECFSPFGMHATSPLLTPTHACRQPSLPVLPGLWLGKCCPSSPAWTHDCVQRIELHTVMCCIPTPTSLSPIACRCPRHWV
jgi:hypothetical protein